MLAGRPLDADLVIVGSGPAGTSTALFLLAAAPSLRGRVVLLERARHPREKIRAGAIGGRAERALATIGVRLDVEGAIVRGLRVITRDGELSVRDDAPIGRVVRRSVLDAALADAARARGARIVEGARVRGVRFGARDVSIEMEDGSSLRARAVVGADGVGSIVRRSMGLRRGDVFAQAVEADTPRVAGDGPDDELAFDLRDGALRGYSWDFPTIVRGERLFCRGSYDLVRWIGHDAATSGSSDDTTRGPDVAARLIERLANVGHAGCELRRFSERGLSLHEPTSRDRALLVGEAAGIDPVLGEGIAQAILYGAAAGPYLARCLARDDLSFAEWRRVFSRSRVGVDLAIRTRALPLVYERRWRPRLERAVIRSTALARAGAAYFDGRHVPRGLLARAALECLRAALA